MHRLSAVIIAASMTVVALSLGAVLHVALGLSTATAVCLSLALLVVMALLAEREARGRERIALGQRLTALERQVERTPDTPRGQAPALPDLDALAGLAAERAAFAAGEIASGIAARAEATLAAEIGALGARLAALAERIDTVEKAVRAAPARSAPIQPAPVQPATVRPALARILRDVPASIVASGAAQARVARTGGASLRRDPKAAAAPLAEPAVAASLRRADLRRAVAAQRIEIHLQPVVSLPQRKTRWYEALTRIRLDDGTLMAPADWIPAARAEGLLPVIDQIGVFRAVQIARRLAMRQSDLGLFCNLFGETLADGDVFPDFLGFLEANPELGTSLTFEIAQEEIKRFGPIEIEALKAVAERGFRFSLDRTSDLRLDFPELAAHGFRFVKVPADVLLHKMEAAGAEIHAADLGNLVARYGMTLIGTGVESEGTVVDLLDLDLRYAQGFVFARPRPVRPDVMGAGPRGLAQAAE